MAHICCGVLGASRESRNGKNIKASVKLCTSPEESESGSASFAL